MAPAEFEVELVHSPAPRQVRRLALKLCGPSTVLDVLTASGWFHMPDFAQGVGIWGRKVALEEGVRAGDRIEVYRGLTVDPKEARRLRYRTHGEKLPKGFHRPRDWAKDMTQSPPN